MYQVANYLGVYVSTIERLVGRLRETGRLADRLLSECSRVTSRHPDRAIRLAHVRNCHLTATETTLNTVSTRNRNISKKTVRNRLCESGLNARRPYVGPPLTGTSVASYGRGG